MTATDEKDLIMVGRIVRSHGVRGEVKVLPESDDPAHLLALSKVFIGKTEADAVRFEIQNARLQQFKKGLTVLLSFEGVVGRDAADALRHQSVFAERDELPPLEDGEFFFHDLIGSRVDTETGEVVGILKDVLELPAHNVYVIEKPGGAEVMIPAVPAFIEKVDVDARQIVIRPIEGLLDP